MSMKRVLSAIQPTGRAHLGNYVGAIQNWVKLQHEHECYFFIADLHALTTAYENTQNISEDTFQLAVDLLAAGLDPQKCVLFRQSDVTEHAELHLIFSMFTPLGWLERVPSYKDKKEELKGRDLNTYGFLGYPLLQAADILLYKADYVPVGRDQLAHLELTREVGRRFNHLYRPVFPECKELLTEVPFLPGTDGRKMSKSYGNTLPLSDPIEKTHKTVLAMMTEPARKRRTDPGDPAKCPVFTYHQIFTPNDKQAELAQGCRSAGIGCIDCKKVLLEHMDQHFAAYRQRRKDFESNPDQVARILTQGAERARKVAHSTLTEVKSALKLT